jgi:hypothetical protein
MARDIANLHALTSLMGMSLCFSGWYALASLGLSNMARRSSQGIGEAKRFAAAIAFHRDVVPLGEARIYRRSKASGLEFDLSRGVKSSGKTPHREHFLAQEIA